jgi:hypothetical protein
VEGENGEGGKNDRRSGEKKKRRGEGGGKEKFSTLEGIKKGGKVGKERGEKGGGGE